MPFEYPLEALQAIADSIDALAVQDQRVQERQDEVDRVKRLLEEEREHRERIALRRQRLMTLAIIARGLPEAVETLRRQMTADMALSNRLDILVSEQQATYTRLGAAESGLHRICPHTFLYYVAAHLREITRNRKEIVHGSLTCLVCGYKEVGLAGDHDDHETYLTLGSGERLSIEHLGPHTALTDLPWPIPWETIRGLFLTSMMRQDAAAIGLKIK